MSGMRRVAVQTRQLTLELTLIVNVHNHCPVRRKPVHTAGDDDPQEHSSLMSEWLAWHYCAISLYCLQEREKSILLKLTRHFQRLGIYKSGNGRSMLENLGNSQPFCFRSLMSHSFHKVSLFGFYLCVCLEDYQGEKTKPRAQLM